MPRAPALTGATRIHLRGLGLRRMPRVRRAHESGVRQRRGIGSGIGKARGALRVGSGATLRAALVVVRWAWGDGRGAPSNSNSSHSNSRIISKTNRGAVAVVRLGG